jgi:hypothetical protein
MGNGKKVVVLCSLEISLMAFRNLSWRANRAHPALPSKERADPEPGHHKGKPDLHGKNVPPGPRKRKLLEGLRRALREV